MTHPTSNLDTLLKDFSRLWQEQCLNALRDPELTQMFARSYAMMQDSLSHAFAPEGSSPHDSSHASPSSAFLLTTLATQCAELAARVSALEERLAASKPARVSKPRTDSKRAGTPPRRTRSK